jgi:hypothetical protein
VTGPYTLDTATLDVDRDGETDETELPDTLACATLDTDHDAALLAADTLVALSDRFTEAYQRVEWAALALRRAEPTSQRARTARIQLRRTLAAFNHVFGGLDEAACALQYGWQDTPPPEGPTTTVTKR